MSEREGVEGSEGDKRLPDEGSLLHVTPVELIGRLVELSYTGSCLFYVGAAEGEVGLYDGVIVDARALGDFGTAALFRMLGATTGSYRLDRRVSQSAPPQSFGSWTDLREEYRRHHKRLARAAEVVGGLAQVWSLRPAVVQKHLEHLPDQLNPLLRRIDGRRTVAQVITETPLEEALSVRALAKLLSLGVLALSDEVIAEVAPLRSPLSTSLVPEAAEKSEPVPVIGSDVPVRPQWFDERHKEHERRAEVRSAVMSGSLAPRTVSEESLDDLVLPPSDPEGEPVDDGDESADVLRPLPSPPDVVEAAAQDGRPDDVAVEKWSSQGAPPPIVVDVGFEGDDGDEPLEVDHGEVSEWLGGEGEFFSTPPAVVEEPVVPEKYIPPPPPREPSGRARLLAAGVLLVGGALLGYLVGQSCSPTPTENSRVTAPAANVAG